MGGRLYRMHLEGQLPIRPSVICCASVKTDRQTDWKCSMSAGMVPRPEGNDCVGNKCTKEHILRGLKFIPIIAEVSGVLRLIFNYKYTKSVSLRIQVSVLHVSATFHSYTAQRPTVMYSEPEGRALCRLHFADNFGVLLHRASNARHLLVSRR